MRDFLQILKEHTFYNDESWNKTDFIYTFPNGSQIEFFGADSPAKLRGPRRDRLFINEANNVPYDAFTQLEVRTRQTVWMDWNPVNEFWFYTDVLNQRSADVDFITLTYKDNEGLPKSIVEAIEARRNNKNWWQVYGLGQLGDVEGKVYRDWTIVDEIDNFARLERYGLDFGYSNDPTAIVGVYYLNGGYILDEITYQTGLSNKQIADILMDLPRAAMVKADSAEPKSIDEIKLYGVNISPVKKGKDSVRQGIQFVQDQRISVTKRSTNILKEYRNYMWDTDSDGKFLDPPKPIGIFNHALDAVRYAFESLRPMSDERFMQERSIMQSIVQRGESW